mgnify:CR=1 FL=1
MERGKQFLFILFLAVLLAGCGSVSYTHLTLPTNSRV